MTQLYRWIAVVVAVLAGFLGTFVRGQSQRMDSASVVALRNEVKAASDRYFRLFSQHQMDTLDDIYNVPLIAIGPTDVVARTTREQVIQRAVTSYDKWSPERTGYLRSEMPNPTICVLNPGAAIVSGKWYRIKKDGSVMTESGIAYFWGKTKSGWRMIGWAGTDKLVPCND